MPVDPRRVKELFVAAADLADPQARQAFLDRECAGDAGLRQRLDRLLAAHDHPHPAVDQPLAGDLPPSESSPTFSSAINQPGGTAFGRGEGTAASAFSPAAPADEQVGAVIAGRYKLLQLLGHGGMGSVFMADQTAPVKRRVAVKLIRGHLDSQALLARFEAERQALAMMDHPNIAKVLDAGTTDANRPYFVMELVKGAPIDEFCDRQRLTMTQRLQLFMQVCSAVQHAHQKGIVHRDLKPSNILVESHDGKPVPKVIDFGLAKAMGGQPLTERSLFTALGSVAGTPLYMAPEQAAFNAIDVDTRADIYALGVVLYELLTGTTPIERAHLKQVALDELLRVIRESDPPTPSKRLSSTESRPSVAACRQMEPARLGRFLRGDLDWIVMKALAKERDRRYATALDLANDIERFLNQEPVTAGPPGAGYRVRKFVRRNRGKVVAAGLLLVSLLVGVAGTTWGLLRAERAGEAERLAKLEAQQAAAREADARKQTQKRLEQIEKGVELLAGLLSGIDPRNEEKGGPTVYEQLRSRAEKAADELQEEAVGDPLAVARLQSILGNTVLELGNPIKAAAVLEKARLTWESKLGPDHPDTLATLNKLATAYEAAGKLPEAIRLYERVRDASVAKLGADHPDTLITLHDLGSAYRAAGRLPEAIRVLEQVRDTRVAKLGADHRDTLSTLNNLAETYRAAGKLPEGIRLLEQVRDAQARVLGADHPDTLANLNNLATAYQEAGKLAEAIRLLEEVRAAQQTKLGPDHPSAIATLGNLATAYLAAGKPAEAIRLYAQVRDGFAVRLGADHPKTLIAMNNLASAYQAAERLPEAIRLFEQVHEAHVAKLGAGHPNTLVALCNLATAYQDAGKLPEAVRLFEQAAAGVEKQGFLHPYAGGIVRNAAGAYEKAEQFDKAEAWRRKWLAALRANGGADSPARADELAGLSLNLLKQKRWADAEAAAREALVIREKKEPEDWKTFDCQSLLGAALLGQKKHAEAELLLLKGYEGMKQREAKVPSRGKPRLTDAMERLVHLYEVTDKKNDAAKWRKELEAIKAAAKP